MCHTSTIISAECLCTVHNFGQYQGLVEQIKPYLNFCTSKYYISSFYSHNYYLVP